MGATRSFLTSSEGLRGVTSFSFRSRRVVDDYSTFERYYDVGPVGRVVRFIPAIPTILFVAEVYCDTLSTEVAKPEDTALLEKSNSSNATIERGGFWKNLSLSRHKPKLEESRKSNDANSEVDKRRGRFLNSLAFLTGLSFGRLATSASSTVKSIAKAPHAFSINLGSSKTSPYFAAYYSQYPYAPLLPYPFFYPFGFAPMIDAAKSQASQNDQTPQVINLFDNRPSDLAGNNEDYTDADKSNEADDRIRLRAEADRNAEEKVRGCKESQRKHSKEMDREYLQANTDSRLFFDFNDGNQTAPDNATTTSPPNNTSPSNNTNTTHHHHHYYHYGGHTEYPHFSGYYGGYPQNIHHVDLTTTPPYNQVSYNVPYEQSTNFYHDNKYNVYSEYNPPFSASFSPDQTNEHTGVDANRLYPSGYPQPPNIGDGFKPLT
ncbi:PREDICTED: uncharacterized protein LOC105570104 [Vollenhovia emeryi]|uniref:uncharacterized protein LOC105570104 n=1 Tax=Vollenhovia emeryi TaxID=411798 RepID=UPI0005F48F6C|nr:PREDICTED: uncharacterized protein LOC105570104 [Vollenhovia emeryi]